MESPAAPSFPDVPKVLPVRLERETPFQHRLGCTFLIAAFLLGVAALMWRAGSASDKKDAWVILVVASVFGFFGALTLLGFVVTFLTRHVPQALAEIEGEPLAKGGTYKLAVIQPGPASLKYVKVELVCLETTRKRRTVAESGRKRRGRSRTQVTTTEIRLHEQVLLKSDRVNEVRGGYWSETVSFTLPTNVPVSTFMADREICWKIIVHSRVAGIMSHSHPYVVKVVDV